MSKYAKFWVAFAFAVLIGGLQVAVSALDDNVVTAQEWVTIALGFLMAGSVFFIPNKTEDDV